MNLWKYFQIIMSLNKFMHPRNPYKTQPNFKQMAIEFPEFRKFVTQELSGKIRLDFSNPSALKILTETLFLKDFQLDVQIPKGCLVPTLPSRMNYLLWIEDLLKLLPSKDPGEIHGLDVGAGAAAVYPLLGVKHFGWRMSATEADAVNYEAASQNVVRNGLIKAINIYHVINSEKVFSEAFKKCSDDTFDFVMCNPPFYNHDKDFTEGDSVGTESEMKTEGGEVEFIKNMISESAENQSKVKIYTVLLGHKSSLSPIKKFLLSTKVSSFVSTEFCQGRIMRWGIAWTFLPNLALKKVLSTKAKKDKQKPFSIAIEKPECLPQSDFNVTSVYQRIKSWLEAISVTVQNRKESKSLCSARISSKERNWQNQRRVKREGKRKKNDDDEHDSESPAKKLNEGKFTEIADNSQEAAPESKLEEQLLHEILTSNTGKKNVRNESLVIDLINDKDDTEASKEVNILECDLFVRYHEDKVTLDLCYLDGDAGRDGVHQLTQFIKNKFISLS